MKELETFVSRRGYVDDINSDEIRKANGIETNKVTISKEKLEEMTSNTEEKKINEVEDEEEKPKTRRNKKEKEIEETEVEIEETSPEEVEVEDDSFEL